MTDKEKLDLYRKGLELTEKQIEFDTENIKRFGTYPFSEEQYAEFIDKLKSNAIWYREQIAELENRAHEVQGDEFNLKTQYFTYEIEGVSKWVQGELFYNKQKQRFEHTDKTEDGREILVFWPCEL